MSCSVATVCKEFSNSNDSDKLEVNGSNYESLNYDTSDNVPSFIDNNYHSSSNSYLKLEVKRWFICLLIGIITSVFGLTLGYAVESIMKQKFKWVEMFFKHFQGNLAITFSSLIALNCIFCLIAAIMTSLFCPEAAGGGFIEIRSFLNGVKIPKIVRIKTLVVKYLGTIFALCSGLFIGKEGPLIHIGAIIAAGISQGRATSFNINFNIFESFRSDHEKRDFVAAGAAAGISAAFGAPIGGLLFSIEEGASFWNPSLTARIFFCSIIATYTLNIARSIMLAQPFDVTCRGLFSFEKFKDTYSEYDLFFIVIIGIFGGILGALFIELNNIVSNFRQKYIKNIKILKILESLFICILTSLSIGLSLIFISKFNQFHGYESVGISVKENIFESPLAKLVLSDSETTIKLLFHSDQNTFMMHELLLMAVAYFILSSITVGICLPAGLFIPLIITGALLGRFLGELVHLIPLGTIQLAHPGIYAFFGSACMLGGVKRITVSICVMMMEISGDIGFALPLIGSLLISKFVGNLFNYSIYEHQLKRSGIPFLDWFNSFRIIIPNKRNRDERRTSVSYTFTHESTSNNTFVICTPSSTIDKLMACPVKCLPMISSVNEIINVLKMTTHNGFPIYSDDLIELSMSESSINNSLKLQGIILRTQLIVLLQLKAFINKGYSSQHGDSILPEDLFRDKYPRYTSINSLNFETTELEELIDLRPYRNPSPYVVYENCSIERAYRLFRALGLRHLPVINYKNHIVGIITRKDFSLAFSSNI